MMRNKLRRALPLVGLLALALAVSGCLGNLSGIAPGPKAPDVNAPRTTIPETDAELLDHVPGQVLVKTVSEAALAELAAAFGATVAEGSQLLRDIGWALLNVQVDGSMTDLLRRLDADPRVRSVQPNYTKYTLPYVKERDLATGFQAADVDDPFYSRMQYGPQTIYAPAVWAQGVTGKGTWVAIIDTGIDPYHPDLAAKLLPGLNPDDPLAGTGDFHGHGTHVAGSAAAMTDNGIGVAGVAPDAAIMPVRVFNPVADQARTSDFAIAVGIIVAGNPGLIGMPELGPAAAANLSLGGPVYSQAILDAVNYAVQRGVVVVASMGNSDNQEVSYPAAYPGVLAVGASDAHDQMADFSTLGPHNSVAAPGVDILSTYPGGGYAFMSGTSMASPHVTGAVALIREKYPDMEPYHVKELFEDTADGELGRFDRKYGYGRLNVAQALLKADGFESKYGILEVYVHDGLGGGGFGFGHYEADVVLWRGDEAVDTARTGGTWGEPNMMFDGMAWFYNLEPGDDYWLTVRLDPDHPWHGVDEEVIVTVKDIRIGAGKVQSVSVPVRAD